MLFPASSYLYLFSQKTSQSFPPFLWLQETCPPATIHQEVPARGQVLSVQPEVWDAGFACAMCI